MLTLEKVTAGYHRLQILHEISIEVNEGEIVSIVGANGAGKTTTLNTIAGLVKPTSGSITFAGKPAGGRRPSDLVQEGLVLVPEGRALFGNLSVEENLQMGGWSRDRADLTGSMDDVFELFPILRERRAQVAETFSGGQQQMLAIGRALMAKPKLLMLDEPSTGLSPKLTWAVLDAIKRIRDTGVAVLLVEQNASQALAMADRAYVLESGSVVLEGPGPQLAQDDRVRAAYLGM
ncbi:MAG TPA: ABC transporter ATP-binding protein [Intrasporangium sp.]|uniref:ABC transporter ATP-binding protein n=1 Tax=Intrasporangium sp. TaxID=1925024 RepID=UPI002F92F5E4